MPSDRLFQLLVQKKKNSSNTKGREIFLNLMYFLLGGNKILKSRLKVCLEETLSKSVF